MKSFTRKFLLLAAFGLVGECAVGMDEVRVESEAVEVKSFRFSDPECCIKWFFDGTAATKGCEKRIKMYEKELRMGKVKNCQKEYKAFCSKLLEPKSKGGELTEAESDAIFELSRMSTDLDDPTSFNVYQESNVYKFDRLIDLKRLLKKFADVEKRLECKSDSRGVRVFDEKERIKKILDGWIINGVDRFDAIMEPEKEDYKPNSLISLLNTFRRHYEQKLFRGDIVDVNLERLTVLYIISSYEGDDSLREVMRQKRAIVRFLKRLDYLLEEYLEIKKTLNARHRRGAGYSLRSDFLIRHKDQTQLIFSSVGKEKRIFQLPEIIVNK